jgi:dTMP kinase
VYKINQYATNGLLPDVTFYIDVEPAEGLRRIKGSSRILDRLDLENCSFHEKVRQGYLEVAKLFPNRIRIINGNRSIDEIYQEIKTIILGLL